MSELFIFKHRGAQLRIKEHDYPGNLIVIEGGDGAGTTTQATKLVENKEFFYTAEHGERREQESKIGSKVEEMISKDGYSAEAIALGFAADRKVHLEEIVIPALKEGKTVICDRYYHSSLTYQPALGANFEWVQEINKFALKPDLTLILQVEAETGMQRLNQRGGDGNIFEEMNFQQEVVTRYQRLEKQLEEKIEYIDASQTISEVYQDICEKLEEENF